MRNMMDKEYELELENLQKRLLMIMGNDDLTLNQRLRRKAEPVPEVLLAGYYVDDVQSINKIFPPGTRFYAELKQFTMLEVERKKD